jgi:hypothetical protein
MPKVSGTYNLKLLHPAIAAQWHPDRNGSLSPQEVTPGSGRKVWWRCRKAHEWRATVASRTRGSGCPRCYRESIVSGRPLIDRGLMKEWHPSLNPGLNPRKLTTAYNRKLWWLCETGHEWQATLRSRIMGSGCPVCEKSGRDTVATEATGNEAAARWEKKPKPSLLQFEENNVHDSYAETDFRREKRYPHHTAVMAETGRHDDITYGLLKDFSPSGMHIETDYPIRDGEKVVIRIKEKLTASAPTRFVCRVRWCRELSDDRGDRIGYSVGLKIIS